MISIKSTQFIWVWSRIKDNMNLSMNAEIPRAAAIMHRATVDKLRAGENWHWAYQAVFSYDMVAAMKKVTCPMFFVSGARDLYHQRAMRAFPDVPSYVNEEGGVYYVESHAPDLAPHVAEFIDGLERRTIILRCCEDLRIFP